MRITFSALRRLDSGELGICPDCFDQALADQLGTLDWTQFDGLNPWRGYPCRLVAFGHVDRAVLTGLLPADHELAQWHPLWSWEVHDGDCCDDCGAELE